ncbi:MAG: DNA polymerase IV [Thermoplasmatota archaeon]
MSGRGNGTRHIIHVDMDAFYASVEQRDDPKLRGKPVIVGGEPRGRGVVAACSYEARDFGIHSAMSSAMAYRLCPQAIFVHPRFDVYKEVSTQVMDIFHSYGDLVEPLSLDEAFMDVTELVSGGRTASDIALEMKERIFRETGLTASAGVSFNKFLAKVASGLNKPDGLTIVSRDSADEFIENLPIRKFHGVGEVTEKRMIDHGILTGRDLRKYSKPELVRMFGRHGAYYYEIAHNLYESPVVPFRERKSIGSERTLSEDIDDTGEMLRILSSTADRLERLMKKRDIKGRTVTLKLRYFDFCRISRSKTVDDPVSDSGSIMKHIPELLERTQAGRLKVRLLGIAVSNLVNVDLGGSGHRQLTLDYFI